MINEKDIRSFSLEELIEELTGLGEKKFRATQIFEWMHARGVDDYDSMTNISKELKEKLKQNFALYRVEVVEVLKSEIDGTRKYLFALHDGNIVESVFMRYEHGNSVCVSSQVGCRMGCRFCASTIDGLVRNLTAGEILGQIYGIMRETGEKISNVVVMGSGEPLDNFDNIIRFAELLSHEKGLNLSGRNLTISTCGLVPKMMELADKELALTLAISLHASSDEKRKALMPIANKYSLDELIKACRYYFNKTGRRLTFEYSLIAGENDTDEDAYKLAELVSGLNCHINLIPVNPIKERSYVAPVKKSVEAFKNKLEKYHINVTIRREMGRDIDGACGQLRRKYLKM